MKKVNRKVPQSVKVKRRIDEAVKQALASGATTDPKLLSPQYVVGTVGTLEVKRTGWIVQNWRRGWLWLSNWMFAAIAWVAIYGVPPEIIALIPEAIRENFIPIMSALGIICRFIDQNRNKPLPLVTAGESDDNRT
ncbi:hypothetical protein I9054_012280 [Acinetobacter bereziniae]|uniref:Uncharacterized protein n=1 Tax=Acinetobacter bereziniae TaxID=106648 RepID=A0A9E7TEM9_ACIBZ|nr:hypothetical protein [Acinetobacter bereziniae]UUN96161.1 hypothetical protein I9054_012280 [Acinetobacter bereziniae]